MPPLLTADERTACDHSALQSADSAVMRTEADETLARSLGNGSFHACARVLLVLLGLELVDDVVLHPRHGREGEADAQWHEEARHVDESEDRRANLRLVLAIGQVGPRARRLVVAEAGDCARRARCVSTRAPLLGR